MRCTKLILRGFRGATRLVEIGFRADAPVTMIFGENGAGKSTIVDAVDFLCNRNFGSLENYSLGVGESARKHVTSLDGTPEYLRVRLVAEDGAHWTASLGRRGPLVEPEEGVPDAHILRRRDVTNVIEAPPSKRYEALKDYLALSGVEKSEETLRAAIRTLERRFDADANALAQAQDTLQQLWQEEGRPGVSALDWAMSQASQDVSELQSSLEEMSRIETAFRSALEARDDLDRALAAHQQSSQVHGAAQQQQRQVSAQTQQATELLALLRDAETFVGAWQTIKSCPVCEQPIGADVLHARLRQRIAKAADLIQAMEAATDAETRVTRSSAVLEQARAGCCERTRGLMRLIRVSRMDEVLGEPVSWETYSLLAREGEATEPAEAEARAALAALPRLRNALTTRRETSQRAIAQHTALRISAERLDTLQERVDSQRMLLGQMKRVLDVVASERKRYAEDILAEVAGEVGTLYASIHPDEPLGRVRFALKRGAASSVELDAGFQDRDDLPPQAYYSESHLDTLGICVFLALAKRFRTERTLVILDDVVTSVDGPHVERFMAMLQAQAPHLNQVIITTHERPWANRFRHDPSVALVELGEWSLEDGIRVQPE